VTSFAPPVPPGFPWELEAAVRDFVAYYNHRRYHESLDSRTPADVCYGRHHDVLTERDQIKQLTMQRRERSTGLQSRPRRKPMNRLLTSALSCPKSSDDVQASLLNAGLVEGVANAASAGVGSAFSTALTHPSPASGEDGGHGVPCP
jgi:hypothetical protein